LEPPNRTSNRNPSPGSRLYREDQEVHGDVRHLSRGWWCPGNSDSALLGSSSSGVGVAAGLAHRLPDLALPPLPLRSALAIMKRRCSPALLRRVLPPPLLGPARLLSLG
jgi:hypothetical protein